MFKIDSEKELISFLKLLSEEAVKKTKESLSESSGDLLAQSFNSRLKKEKDELYEEEEEKVDDSEASEEPGQDQDPSLQEPAESETTKEDSAEEEENVASDTQGEELKPSLDALERFINALRAAKSLKDSTVSDQLEIFFDRLGDEEKELLVLFMREVSRILSGKVQGDSAINPNDDPYNLDVVSDDAESEASEAEASPESDDSAEATGSEDQATETSDETGDEEEAEEEDTTPPISVGGPQNIQEIRKKIKNLMRL